MPEGSTVPRLVYRGKHAAVDVPHLRLAEVAFGVPFDIDDKGAELLLAQPGNWAREDSDEGRAAVAEVAARVKRKAAAERAAKRAEAAADAQGEPAAPAGTEG
jgi:hypothetical protein